MLLLFIYIISYHTIFHIISLLYLYIYYVASYHILCLQDQLTLLDAPLQLRENVHQQDFAEWLEELREDVTDGVQSMVTRGRHPLGLLEADRAWSTSVRWMHVNG